MKDRQIDARIPGAPGSSGGPQVARPSWLLGALVDAAVVYPWYLLLSRLFRVGQHARGPGFVSLLAFAVLAGLLMDWLERIDASDRLARWLSGSGGVLLALAWGALLAGWGRPETAWGFPAVLNILALIWAWQRGLSLPDASGDHGLVLQRVQRAVIWLVVAIVAGLLLLTRSDSRVLQTADLTAGLLLLAAGLLWLAAAHQAEIRSGLAARGASPGGQRRFWSVVALLVSLLAVGAALVEARLFGGVRLSLLSPFLEPVRLAADAVLGVVLRAVGWLLTPLVTLLSWLLRRAKLFKIQPPGNLGGSQDPPPPLPEPPRHLFTNPLWRYAGLAVLLGLGGLLLARSVSGHRRRRDLTRGLVEVHESLWDWSSLSPRPWLAALLTSLRARPSAAEEGRGGGGADGPAWQLRRLFRRYLALGERLGRPRQPAESPARYLPEFLFALTRAAAPGTVSAEGLAAPASLTRMYEAVRYGEQEPGTAELDAAAAGLERLEKELTERPGDAAEKAR